MIIFLDENDVEYGALATIKATNAVNGERSITGEITSGDVVLSRIERGWRLRFEDEYYVVTFAKPIDEGKNVQVSFDAVHQFFWDFGKSSVYDQLSDGSHTFRAYLDFIFDRSGYTYDIETSLMVKAFEKQSFGYKNRLSLFNDIITSSGVEFQVNGKVVRILAKVGTDLSTVVRKNFNLNELGIEKNIGDFVTYQKGFGAYFDEEDHSKGRLIVEYTSPLASIYGKLEADPLVDERYKQQESLLNALKNTVDNSYTISVSLDMEDLTRAGYRYTQPVAGDYIMAINETLGFKEKIRIVSFTSEYDVAGQLIKHTVTCNDIGSVKKLSASYTQTQHQAANAEENANTAYEFANKALVSANGKNTNYYGDTFPVDNPKGTLKKGDLLFLTVGDTVKQYYWNGAEWVINPVVSDVEAFKEQIAEELKDVPDREEFENKISEELANSKAEIETQIETAKTQAESNAKEYADTINQETAKVAEQANTAADEIKADLVNVKNNLTSTSIVANNAQAAVDEAKQELTEVASDLNTAKQDLANSVTAVNTKVDSTKAELTQAKQDLMSHAQQLQTQANAQTELTKRVTIVETTANGTKTTVNELTKTVAQNGKDITSVTNRTKTVEDDLANTKTTLTQVQTTANSASQKTATLETGLNGLSAKFDNLNVGGTNLIKQSTAKAGTRLPAYAGELQDQAHSLSDWIKIEPNTTYTLTTYEDVNEANMYYSLAWYSTNNADYSGWISRPTGAATAADLKGGRQYASPTNAAYAKVSYPTKYSKVKLERGNISTDYSQNGVDFEQKVAEYQASNDKMVASLRSSLQTTDGNVSNLQTKVEAVPGQITSAVSAVEGKIPKSAGGRNLALDTSADWSSGWTSFNGQNNQTRTIYRIYNRGLKNGDKVNVQLVLKYSDIVAADGQTAKILPQGGGNVTHWGPGGLNVGQAVYISLDDDEVVLSGTTTITEDHLRNDYWSWQLRVDYVASGCIQWKEAKAEAGDLPTPWSPAPEDAANQISSLSSQIKQTADGMTFLATKTELNTAKSDLQSGISTATSKADNAQATANSNAQTIITHTTQISALNTGLSAKVSQTDFNTLSGRVTTAENNIIAKANELSSKITSVEGKIPTELGVKNLIIKSTAKTGVRLASDGGEFQDQAHALSDWIVVEPNAVYTLTCYEDVNEANMYYSLAWYSTNNNDYSGKISRPTGAATADSLKGGKQYQAPANAKYAKVSYPTKYAKVKLERGNISTDYTPAPEDYDSKLASVQSEIKQTTDSIKASVQSLDNSTVKSSSLTINTDGVVIKAGKSTSDFANAIGSYFSVNQNAINLFSDKINVKGNMIVSGAITSDKIASKQINTAHLNGKIITADVISSNAVTADAIKAGAVTTDKMSANSINGDRITAGTLDAAKIKAGSISASQIASGTLTSEQIKAGAIKSINIEASAITSDKIASNSIDASKIVTNGLTANIIKGGKLQSLSNATNFELDTGKLFYNNNNTGVFRVQSGASTMGLKFTNTAITVNGSSKVLSRVILGGDRRESTLDDGKWDQGGFTGIVAETINGVASNAHDKADTLRAIGDNIYFTHSYETDALTGVSAAGWKMETYAPDTSYKGNVVLKPYGVSYRQSNIVVGDLRLDNGDGSGYWMRATINVLKACFGHIVNGGVSGDALSAIQSELNKISGT